MKLSVLSFFKRKKGPSRNELMRSFKVKYDNFKLLLESNTELLKIISDIEQKLRGRSGFGLPYIEAQTMRAFFHCARMVQCLEKMSGRPHPLLKKSLDDMQQVIKGESGTPVRAACPDLILKYERIGREMADAVGEKNANLGEVRNRLSLRIPRGFAITTTAFDRFMAFNQLGDVVQKLKA
ncbi:MAG TPA: PEP/pyruvate-binding domain-containing protein, partial [Desulfobacterales bacterium]|nr:PEP/pyruvate-binding domain-containing protein [Desulfobacterales bacterium]